MKRPRVQTGRGRPFVYIEEPPAEKRPQFISGKHIPAAALEKGNKMEIDIKERVHGK